MNNFPEQTTRRKIGDRTYYRNYHGHEMHFLKPVFENLKSQRDQKMIFFAGDSTLDNKYWFQDRKEALNGYEHCLKSEFGRDFDPAYSKADVCYWVNKFAEEHQKQKPDNFCCINTAVEATTLGQRATNMFRQDEFIRDNITEKDVLVCCIGGNDVALAPTFKTVMSAASVLTQSFFTKPTTQKAGTGRFIEIFGKETQEYLKKLTSKTKPKLVIVCMVYFLDEDPKSQSWAGMALKAFRYNSKPEILQEMMRQCYNQGTKKIDLDGTKVVHLPLYEVLDGKNPSDYCMRVEPSPQGGEKMGKAIMKKILDEYEF